MTTLASKYEALDYLSQLGRETVLAYEASSDTIDDIVDALLAMQVLSPAVTKGTITGAIAAMTRSIKADGDSILHVLLKLRETTGGYIEVDNDRQLNWLDDVGEDKGQQLRYGKNIEGISRAVDYKSLANRIYAYGTGEGAGRIELSGAGYVEDAPSQSTWGGIYTKVFINRAITTQATLDEWGAQLLLLYKDPEISYRINAADLAQQVAFYFDDLQVGSIVKVIDEDLDIDVSARVVRIQYRDLLNPHTMEVTLSTRMKDIADLFADVNSAIDMEQQLAAIISGEQITGGTIPTGPLTGNAANGVNAGGVIIDGDKITLSAMTLDDLADGATYERLKGTEIVAGEIYLTSASMIIDKNGIRTADSSTRLELKSTGIRGYNSAVLQVEISAADGKMYAAAGAIILDSSFLTVKGQAIRLQNAAGGSSAFLWVNSSDLRIDAMYGAIVFQSSTKKILPWTSAYELGDSGNPWGSAYIAQLIMDNSGIYPTVNNGENVGKSSRYFGTGYFNTVYVDDSLRRKDSSSVIGQPGAPFQTIYVDFLDTGAFTMTEASGWLQTNATQISLPSCNYFAIKAGGAIYPATGNTGSCGLSGYRWAEVHSTKFYFDDGSYLYMNAGALTHSVQGAVQF